MSSDQQEEKSEAARLAEAPCACYACTEKGRVIPGHELTCSKGVPEWAIELEREGRATRYLAPGGYRWRPANLNKAERTAR